MVTNIDRMGLGVNPCFLVMGITGKVGGATARHLLAQGKKVRALVRDREKAANWADQAVELVEGDWNDAAAIERALEGVEGAFVMLPAVWAPSPDFKEAKSVIANYVEALTKAAPPRVVALSSMGANRTSGLGMITALSLLEQGFRDLKMPVAYVRAGGFFENFLYGLHVAQGEVVMIGTQWRRNASADLRPPQCATAWLFSTHCRASADFNHSPATWRVLALRRFQMLMVEIASNSPERARSS